MIRRAIDCTVVIGALALTGALVASCSGSAESKPAAKQAAPATEAQAPATAATGDGKFVVPRAKGPGPAALTSADKVALKFSDRPLAVPTLAVTDLDGKKISSADWRGKTVLINFWATWCGPCRAEIPTLIALQNHYRDSVVIIGLSIDEGPAESVREFVRATGINYPVAIVGPEITKLFGGIPAVPTTFVVTPDGGIVQRHAGALNPAITEHEIRVLSAFESQASVEVVQDTGQVLLANAAFATEIPGVSFTGLSSRQKETALSKLNTDHCTCPCGLTLAQCRINDPACNVSLPIAQKVVADIAKSRK